MNTNRSISTKRCARLVLAFLAWQVALGVCPTTQAYPPGPYHVLYGTARDQYGTALTSPQAQVVLETPSGVQFSAPIVPGISLPGVNYLLKVPMDSGVTPDAYQPDALVPAAPFKIVVVIGTVTNLPIEMTGTNSILGLWAKTTRMDLTLGVDSNGDGIPDAWETGLLATLGLNMPLSAINGNTILPPNGLTLEQEYLLATGLSNPANPPVILFVGFNGNSATLQFATITGRSYTILGSTDLSSWSPVAFNLSTDGQGSPTRAFYFAPGTATIQVYVVPAPAQTKAQFYRVVVS